MNVRASVERTLAALALYIAACNGVLPAQQPRGAVAIDTAVVRQTVRWANDWTPAKHILECVAAHAEVHDSGLAWVQDSVVSYADSAGCPRGRGVVVVLDTKIIRLGPQLVIPLLARIATLRHIPLLCGLAGLSSADLGRGWESVPVEWCVYRKPEPES